MAGSICEGTFKKEVLESPIPVLVDFWAPWCGLCRLIEPLLIQFQADYAEPLKVIRVNADENLRLAKDYRLQTLPTLLLFHQGQLVHRMEGFHSREQTSIALRELLNQAIVPASV